MEWLMLKTVFLAIVTLILGILGVYIIACLTILCWQKIKELLKN